MTRGDPASGRQPIHRVGTSLSARKTGILLAALANGVNSTNAAKLIHERAKFVRRLMEQPEFQRALEIERVESLSIDRAGEAPRSFAVAIQIRDDPNSSAAERLEAIRFIQGKPAPKAKAASKPQPAQGGGGYVVDLTPKPAYQVGGNVIQIIPRRGNTGETAKDAAAEIAEAHKPRPTRG